MADPKAPPGGFQQGGWYEGRQYWNGSFSEKGQIHSASDQVGAGKAVSKEVLGQTDVAAGQAVGTNYNYLYGKQSQPSSKEQVSPYLNTVQSSAFSADGAPEVKIPTMDELKTTLAPEGGRPELINRVAEYEKLREQQGVAGLEQQQTSLKAQLEEEAAVLRAQRFDEEGKPVALNVIAGRVTEEERAYNERIDAVNRQLNTINDQLNTSYSVINMYMGFIGADYQDAVTQYNEDFSNNLSMYNIITGARKEARSIYESDRAAASANLTTMTNLITSGNLDYNSLAPEQKTNIAKLEVQAGLPIGFTANLKLDEGAREVFRTENKGVVQIGVRNADGTVSVQTYGTKISGDTDDEGYETPTAQEAQSALIGKAKEAGVINSYGHISPEDMEKMRQAWYAEGLTEEDFNKRFSPYIDPNRDEADYGI